MTILTRIEDNVLKKDTNVDKATQIPLFAFLFLWHALRGLSRPASGTHQQTHRKDVTAGIVPGLVVYLL